jgi:hypothetical protein
MISSAGFEMMGDHKTVRVVSPKFINLIFNV